MFLNFKFVSKDLRHSVYRHRCLVNLCLALVSIFVDFPLKFGARRGTTLYKAVAPVLLSQHSAIRHYFRFSHIDLTLQSTQFEELEN